MEGEGATGPNGSKQGETVSGIVVESLPNTLFKVELSPDKQILAYLAGKMRLHRIRVLVGDRVEVVLDPYGGKGRIVRRN
jgi:translation initiation factor IF-1